MAHKFYVKRLWQYEGKPISTVLDVTDSELEAARLVADLRARYQSTQYDYEPYDETRAGLGYAKH